MNKNLRNRLLVIVAVISIAVFYAFPIDKRVNLGLDLKGGMHVVLRVETEKLPPKSRNDAVLRAMEILRNRIDAMGVGETVIQRQGQSQILVQLPGVTDRDAALKMIGKTALLEFKLVNSDPVKLKAALDGNVPEGYELKYIKKDDEPILVSKTAVLTGEAIKDARVDFDQTGFGQPKISLAFNPKGAKKFAEITKEHVGERLAIIVDGVVLSAPNIREPILSGRGEITGVFDFDEASMLALQLRSGALPAPMHIEEERTIGPLLGKDSIVSGIKATIIGGIAVLIFMAAYYLITGLIADIALLLNLIIIVGSMGFLNAMLPQSQVTLTLPGIAGIILTLGMAVDANVLINERIREELDNGRPLQAAISAGYDKAFKAIFDSNITTLIAAFMLFQFGSGPIKGFAVTLAIGLLASLFTALVVTRAIIDLLIHYRLIRKLPMMRLLSRTNINFISKRYFCYVLSLTILGLGIYSFISKGEKTYGIDFAGGQLQEYRFEKPVSAHQLREKLKAIGITDVAIQQFADNPENIIIRTKEDTYDEVTKVFKKQMPNNKFQILRIERVGPGVGKLLRRRAILAIVFALGGILIFVGFRFKHFDFATAGVIALLHDVLVSAGMLVLLGRQIDLLVVTALLTIAGYSINDTIVIYDRVRENLGKFRKVNMAEIINTSINQTLGRTILTTLTTLLVVIALYMLGGEVLNTFALCLLIGFIAGTYSTIFIASPLVLAWQKRVK